MTGIKQNQDFEYYRLDRGGTIITCLGMFMIIYSTLIYGDALTTERVVLVTLFLFMLLKRKLSVKISSNYKSGRFVCGIFISQILLLIYSSCILLSASGYNGTTVTIGILRLLIFGGFFYIVMINLLHSVEELMVVLLAVTLAQCIIICAGLVSPSIANFLDTVINRGEQYVGLSYDIMRRVGYASGIACITSWGAMKLSFGLIACAYFLMVKENIFLYSLLFVFICGVGTAVARTTLVLTVVVFVVILLYMFRLKSIRAVKIISNVLLVIILVLFILNITGLDNRMPSLFKRLINLFVLGPQRTFFESYFNDTTTSIPPISVDTIIGTGIVSGISANGVLVNADGEFVRLYTAFGLPLAIIFYVFLYISIINTSLCISQKHLRFLAFVFLFFLLLGEFKEYFIYESYMLPMMAVYFDLAMRQNQKKYGVGQSNAL